MGLIQRLLGLIGAILGWIGGIFGAIFGIFRRRPQTESTQETAFFLDTEDAKSIGRQNEPAPASPTPTPKSEPVAVKPTPSPTMVFSSGSPNLANRRRPGANMNPFLDMAKQIRRP